MRLRSKLTSEMCFDGKKTQNRLKTYNFKKNFLENLLPLKKSEKHYFIFYYKNRNTSQFLALTTKNDFRNVSENGKFRF